MEAVRGASASVAAQPIAPSAGTPAAGASAPAVAPSGATSQRSEASQSNESTQELVARANAIAQASQLQVRFTVRDDNKAQITMYSPIDGSVIRQIPDMKLRDMMAQVKDTLGGLMVNQLV